MEQNDVSVRPSKQEIMFGDDYIFSYSGSGRSVCGMVTGHEPIELDSECEHHEPVPDCDRIEIEMAGERNRELEQDSNIYMLNVMFMSVIRMLDAETFQVQDSLSLRVNIHLMSVQSHLPI